MPPPRQRHADNNPTERIQRLLVAFGDCIAYYETLEQWIADNAPEAFTTLPPRPDISEYQLESQRQQFTYSKTIRARKAMARMRSASEDPRLTSNAKQQLRAIAKHGLTEERKQEILAMIEDEAAPPPATAQLIDAAAAADKAIGLPAGVEIEPDPETQGLDADLKEGSLFK